ncbi:MAG: HAMP domain-containing histidine kinase, partial [Bacteroidota bacterium]|nr:HAMP domain-containing histidine kinase [Bacteroidota bacterium]
FNNRNYYVFISAQDKYGFRELNYLQALLVISYIAAIILIWLLSFHLSRLTLTSLSEVTRQIEDSNTKRRKINLAQLTHNDEIKTLATAFNRLMDRIEEAYSSQRAFTSNAAHELRTPVARLSAQLENIVKAKVCTAQVQLSLQNTIQDVHQLSEVITSLLLLSKIEANDGANAFAGVRIDEALFAARAQLLKIYPDFKFHFSIENTCIAELSMEVKGDETLLVIAFLNVLRNAYAYSDNQSVHCSLQQVNGRLEVRITNSGETPKIEDIRQLFTTFKRGSNSTNKPGSGIGLSIVQRILQYHGATLTYNTPTTRVNEIIICFWS